MGYTSPAETNVVDLENSTATPLGSLGIFTGQFKDVSAYSSISVACKSDVASLFSGIVIDWSTNGVTADLAPQDFTFDPAALSEPGFRVHATIAANYYRVRYLNGSVAQASFHLTALLRKGSQAGTVRTIDPANTFTTNLDVQTVQAILSGRGRANPEQIQMPVMDDLGILTDGPFLFVVPRPGVDSKDRQITPASLTAVLVAASNERRYSLSITNDVLRGNLYLGMGNASVSTTSYDYLVVPGETWNDPSQFGSVWPGDIYGIWDEVYIQSPAIQAGNARFFGGRYG